LSNNGYTVIDLGKQTPAETIITKAVEVNADAIGLSALLVSTSKQMPLIVNELDRRGLNFPVLIGGAAINERFGRRILQTENGNIYGPGVFYCKDAFAGLDTMEALRDDEKRPALMQQMIANSERELGLKIVGKEEEKRAKRPSSIPPAEFVPKPEKWGVRIVKTMPFDTVFQLINKKELFRLNWGAKNARGERWAKLQEEFEERLEQMRRENINSPWLYPQGVYGYWPAQSDGNELIIFDPESVQKGKPDEMMRFNNPRQVKDEYICLSDYFSPVTSGIIDTVAFQVVTVGLEATKRFDRFQDNGEYSEAYFTHGLAVQMAEATAEHLHRHIRRELGIKPDQGKRYSWGFPAIPDIEDHEKIFQLLPAEMELNMALTSAYQLVPEQSTAAIIVHHPHAKYYDIGESRIEQLMNS